MRWCLVVDKKIKSIPHNVVVFDWNNYETEGHYISIPTYIERHADRLRARIIKLLTDLRSLKINGKDIVKHLEIVPGFSLWWMSLTEEKSLYKSPQLFDCLRIIALEELLHAGNYRGLIFSGEKGVTSRSIKHICSKREIEFQLIQTKRCQNKSFFTFFKKGFRKLPHFVQGFTWLSIHTASRWKLRNATKHAHGLYSGKISIFSYFIHLNREECEKGIFSSRHWGGVVKLLNQSTGGTNWFHHYLESPEMPDKNTGLSLLKKINSKSTGQAKHLFVESFISLKVFFRVLLKFIKLNKIKIKIKNMHSAFTKNKLPIWLWYMMQNDINSSMIGRVAVQNILWLELFDSLISKLPKQHKGFYLSENQGWERALIFAWKKHGHGDLIAVAHSTLRYWDLRYFEDYKKTFSNKISAGPMPDKLAVNGPAAFRAIKMHGYPNNRIIKVEAQRYLHLSPNADSNQLETETNTAIAGKKRRLLVLGDISEKNTNELMTLLQQCAKIVNNKYSVYVKPHPSDRTQKYDYPFLKFQITNSKLNSFINRNDFILAANSTSAALDSLLLGKKVIVHLLPGEINLSPLRGMKKIAFISNLNQLVKALDNNNGEKSVYCKNYFWLDSSLKRWKNIILT